jgi:serine/threonine-protein kinase
LVAADPYDPAGAPPAYGYEEEEVAYGEPPRRSWWWELLGAIVLVAAIVAAILLLTSKSSRLVPNVVDQQEAAATTALQNAGFNPVSQHVTNPKQQGTVIGESPRAGAHASKGSTVRITVSDGPGVRQIPDVSGLGRLQAKRILVRAGFHVTEQTVTSDSVPVYHVVSTQPGAREQLQIGSVVTINVSTGPQKVTVPSVVGKQRDEATTLLQAAGFTVVTTNRQANQPQNTVLAQSPAGNSQAAKGSAVVITIAQPFQQVMVPDVTGKNVADAFNMLSAAGFSPTTVAQSVTDPTQDGIVLSQRPTGGRTAKKGSKVTMVIGQLSSTTTTPPTTTAPPATGH